MPTPQQQPNFITQVLQKFLSQGPPPPSAQDQMAQMIQQGRNFSAPNVLTPTHSPIMQAIGDMLSKAQASGKRSAPPSQVHTAAPIMQLFSNLISKIAG